MKLRVLAASLLAAILLAAPAAAVGLAGSDGLGGDMIDGAENFADDLLPDVAGTTDEMYADSSLGDTDGDGVIGTTATESRTDAEATDTAQSSSGEAEDSGMSAFGVILTVVIIGAVVVLIFALIPKKREG